MSKRRITTNQDDTLIDITQVKESTESFLDKYQKKLTYGALALGLLVGGYFAFKYFYKEPREKEAANQIFKAEQMFEQDSFALALKNPGGGYKGFLDIADQYSGTKAGNLANYYVGVCYLNLGENDAAIEYLNDFCPCKSKIAPSVKHGLLGDAYSEKQQFDKAITQYEKAASASDNEITAPYYLLKLGMLQEKQKNLAAAQKAYQSIKEKYPMSQIGGEVEKHLARVSVAK